MCGSNEKCRLSRGGGRGGGGAVGARVPREFLPPLRSFQGAVNNDLIPGSYWLSRGKLFMIKWCKGEIYERKIAIRELISRSGL